MPGEEPLYIDDDHQRISEFAADYFDDDERDEFVDTLMERRGYQRIQGWGPPADPGPDPQGGGRKPGRRAGGAPPPQRRAPYFKR